MLKFIYALSFVLFITGQAMAQLVVPLYPGKIPGSKPLPPNFKESAEQRTDGILIVSNVSEPSLTAYLPAKEIATGTAVIICPGGGYGILAMGHEGYAVAEEFNKIGIAAFVLKYRLPNDATMMDKQFGPLQDLQQAMYLLRKNAAKWNLKTDKIGVMGFSAGGHLASSFSVHYDDVKIAHKEVNLRPDFSILIYPVVSLLESPHVGSGKNLLGAAATQEQLTYFSAERNINAKTPPAFLVHAMDDDVVPVQNSIIYGQALVKHKVPAELHLYQAGGHGFGLHNKTTSDQWFERLKNWLSMNKLINN